MKKKIKLVINKASSFVAPLFNQPKKHLKTWLVIFLALIAGLAAFFFLLSPQTTEAAWWDETWLYRKAVQISNSNGADLTDFQVAITLDTTSLITAGKMQGDCDDLRITDQNGQVLPHWIEENNPGCNNAATRVWVKVPTVHKGTNATTIYVYYGNSQAENAENGDNVFEFFDDFNSSTLDASVWAATNTYTISGGEITIASGAVYTNSTILATAQNYVYEYRVRWNASNGTYSGLQIANAQNVANSNSTSKALVFYMSQNNSLSITGWAADGTTTGYNLASNQAQYAATQGTYYVDSFVVNPTNIIFLNNRSQTNSYAGTWSYAPYLWLGHFFGSNAGATSIKSMTTDWVLVRKYASSDPTAGAPATEETSPGPVAYWKFDEGTGTTAHDSSGQANDGVINGATWQTEEMCVSGKCLRFNGVTDDFIDYGQQSSLKHENNSFSISAWIKLQSTTTQYIINDLDRVNGAGYGIVIATDSCGSSAKLAFIVQDGRTGWLYNCSGLSNPQINTWYHAVGVYNSTNNTSKFYINGELVSSVSLPSGYAKSSKNFKIGRSAYHNGAFFNGFIDEVKIYPYARSEKQIKSDYIAGASSKGSSAVFGHKTETAPITSLASKLVAYWKFDEGYGTTAHDAVGANHGTLATGDAAPTWTNEGKVGKALSFDGVNDYISMSNQETLNSGLMYELTISAWIYPRQFTNNTYETIVAKLTTHDSGGCGYQYGLVGYYNTSQIRFFLDTTGGGLCQGLISNSALSTGKWHHVAGTYNSSTGDVKIYINGNLDKTGSFSGPIDTDNTYSLRIGKSAQAFNGLIDEVKIYNYALTPEEVALDYNQGKAAVMGQSSANTGSSASAGSAAQEYCVPGSSDYCAPPVAEWNFEENQGATAHDTSGNGNDGTLVNMDNSNWVAGANGSGAALSFDGVTNYITVIDTTDSSLDASETMTIQARVKNQGEPSGMQSILRKEGAYALRYSSGNLNGIIWSGGSPKYTTSVVKGTSWDTEKWNHWSFVFTGSSLQMFKNGQKIVADNSFTGPIDTNNSTLGIAATGTGDNKFPGLIDQVRIYDYARTPAQIAWDYNRGGPVGHWRFDECEGTVAHDVSGNENHGTINIGATAPQTAVGTCQTPGTAWGNGAAGKLNSAMSFDGVDDWVDLGINSYNFGIRRHGTFSVWVKPTSATNHDLISDWQSNVGITMRVRSDYKAEFYVYPNNYRAISDSVVFSPGVWSHYVGVMDYDEIRLYVNGKQIAQTNLGGEVGNSATTLKVGRRGDLGSGLTNGLIDDVRIYNYALTDEQIKILYNDGAVRFGE